MLGRFTKERQRVSKANVFNLNDEEDLTHYGQSLSNMDDFEGTGLAPMSEDEDSDGTLHIYFSIRLR